MLSARTYGYRQGRGTRNAGANPRPGSTVNNVPITDSKDLSEFTNETAPSSMTTTLFPFALAAIAGVLMLAKGR